MRRPFIKFILVLALLPVLGLGCKGLSDEQKTAVRPVTLTYWTVFNDVTQLKALAEEYRRVRPYVTVKVRKVRYDEFDRLFANALADDVGPDVVSMHTRWLRKYTRRLSPMPRSVNMARVFKAGGIGGDGIEVQEETVGMPSVSSVRNDYVKTVAEDVVVGNKVYGLPLSIDTLAIYYNKDLLDRAGVPTPPRSWDDLLDAIKASTRFGSDGRIIQAGAALGGAENIANSFDILSLLMMQSGVRMASGNRVTFQSGSVRANEQHPLLRALDFYTDFANPLKESYTWNERMGNALDEFVRGKVVFYFGFGYDFNRIKRRAPGLNVGVLPVPQLNNSNPKNVANYWVESVVAKSKNKDAAWDFVRFLTSPEQVAKYTQATRTPTPLRSQIRSQQEIPELEPLVSQVLFIENWYKGKDVDAAQSAFHNLITGYLEPPAKPSERNKRDAALIDRTARLIQQTL